MEALEPERLSVARELGCSLANNRSMTVQRDAQSLLHFGSRSRTVWTVLLVKVGPVPVVHARDGQ